MANEFVNLWNKYVNSLYIKNWTRAFHVWELEKSEKETRKWRWKCWRIINRENEKKKEKPNSFRDKGKRVWIKANVIWFMPTWKTHHQQSQWKNSMCENDYV